MLAITGTTAAHLTFASLDGKTDNSTEQYGAPFLKKETEIPINQTLGREEQGGELHHCSYLHT